jgi:hypothetical protein
VRRSIRRPRGLEGGQLQQLATCRGSPAAGSRSAGHSRRPAVDSSNVREVTVRRYPRRRAQRSILMRPISRSPDGTLGLSSDSEVELMKHQHRSPRRQSATGPNLIRTFLLCVLSPVIASVMLSSCDCFWEASGHVTACGTIAPVTGATVSCRVDKGVVGGPVDCTTVYTTDATGNFHIFGGEPCHSWVTITIQKPGFDTLQKQVQGRPEAPLQLCLTPTLP